ncbi:MAG: hypothetical protein NT118_06275 [Lentisphaerae bacterium]|nr:hypothetical protein [Lentisphaerota bacterium]
MKRIITKIGDIFVVKLNDTHVKYFQYVANDPLQLNSCVIRTFKNVYPINTTPDLSDLIKGEVEFYAHCVIKWGYKMGLWQKVGNISDVGNINVIFRCTNDCGSKPGEQVIISSKWYVWKINDKDYKRVGKLEGENRKSEIGVVVSPNDIVTRMQTGKYDFFFPKYK